MMLRRSIPLLVVGVVACTSADEPAPVYSPTHSVSAGADQVVDERSTVTLSGSVDDPGDAVVVTRWVQTVGEPVELDDPAQLSATFTAPTTGDVLTLGFRLEAEDGVGGLAVDDTVVVIVTTNTNPLVNAGDDQQVNEGEVVTLSGEVHDEGTVTTTWSQFAGPEVTLENPAALETTFPAPATREVAVLGFRLEAVDDYGASAADYVLVTVLPIPNIPPTADAGPDQVVTSGDLVTLAAGASDEDGELVRIAWQEVATELVELSDPGDLEASFEAPDVDFPTAIVLQLEVEDDDGAVAADQVTITVMPLVPVNRPPSVYAGENQALGSGSAVTLSGAAEDPDGFIVSTTWSQIAGPEVTLADPSSLETTFTAPEVQCAVLLIFELEAEDNEGATGKDRVSILIDGVTAAPIEIPAHLDLENDDGGLVTEGSLWEWGVPASGPNQAYLGTRLWATNLEGNYEGNAFEVLCMPPLNLAAATEPILTFRSFRRIGAGDGFTVEGLDPNAGWVPLTGTVPAMDRVVAGRPAFTSTPVGQLFFLTAVRLPSWLGETGRIRFVFSSDSTGVGSGVYLDEIRVDEEDSDPDGDGLVGVLGEWLAHGTDPFIADTDGDGFHDGEEIAAGTDPLNPADFPGLEPLVPGFVLDFESDDGGLATSGSHWQHGAPSSGPGSAFSGARVWATNLDGNHAGNRREFLYLPPVDLTATPSPTLFARLWLAAGNGDGLSIEVRDPATREWVPINAVFPAYDATDGVGLPAWRSRRYLSGYLPIAADLSAHIGERVLLRFAFRSDSIGVGAGAYLDDLAIFDESDDPDGDGIPGILGELSLGTDPFDPDTDGDGVSDGDERAAGADPLNPAEFPDGPILEPGDLLDFEDGPDGLASPNSRWQHGVIASGPGLGASGSQGWATNLSGNHGGNWREFLYLPPVELDVDDDALLSFELWVNAGFGDGLSVERLNAAGEWATLMPVTPAYESTDAIGRPAWRVQRDDLEYVRAEFSLAEFAGERVMLRLAFRSDGIGISSGAYIDDLAIELVE